MLNLVASPTKSIEAKPLISATKASIVIFLFEDIFTHFGVPREIITDQGAQFTSNLVEQMMERYKIRQKLLEKFQIKV